MAERKEARELWERVVGVHDGGIYIRVDAPAIESQVELEEFLVRLEYLGYRLGWLDQADVEIHPALSVLPIRVTIKDYSHYDPRRSRNGGEYGYEEYFNIVDGKAINGEHWTTSDFDYCPLCGCFERHLQEHLERWHDGEDDYMPSLLAQNIAKTITDNDVEATVGLLDDGVSLEVIVGDGKLLHTYQIEDGHIEEHIVKVDELQSIIRDFLSKKASFTDLLRTVIG